jgi:hypothetical protein
MCSGGSEPHGRVEAKAKRENLKRGKKRAARPDCICKYAVIHWILAYKHPIFIRRASTSIHDTMPPPARPTPLEATLDRRPPSTFPRPRSNASHEPSIPRPCAPTRADGHGLARAFAHGAMDGSLDA